MKRLDPRSVIIGFLVAVIGFMSLGAVNTTFDSITVGKIIMKDEILSINDKSLAQVVTVVAGEGNSVFFSNKKGDYVTTIGQSDNGDGAIVINNKDDQETIVLSHTPDGHGRININNKDGQESIALSHSTVHNGLISVNNKHEKNIVWISATEEGDGHIVLSDRYGEGQWGRTGKRK